MWRATYLLRRTHGHGCAGLEMESAAVLPTFNEVAKTGGTRLPGSNVIDGLIQRGSRVRFSWQAVGSRSGLAPVRPTAGAIRDLPESVAR